MFDHLLCFKDGNTSPAHGSQAAKSAHFEVDNQLIYTSINVSNAKLLISLNLQSLVEVLFSLLPPKWLKSDRQARKAPVAIFNVCDNHCE